MADFTVYQSDDPSFSINVSVPKVYNTTLNAELEFSIFSGPGLPISQALLALSTQEDEIDKVEPTTFTWSVPASALAGLTPGRKYKWYVRYTEPNGKRTTLDEGTIQLTPGVRPT